MCARAKNHSVNTEGRKFALQLKNIKVCYSYAVPYFVLCLHFALPVHWLYKRGEIVGRRKGTEYTCDATVRTH